MRKHTKAINWQLDKLSIIAHENGLFGKVLYKDNGLQVRIKLPTRNHYIRFTLYNDNSITCGYYKRVFDRFWTHDIPVDTFGTVHFFDFHFLTPTQVKKVEGLALSFSDIEHRKNWDNRVFNKVLGVAEW